MKKLLFLLIPCFALAQSTNQNFTKATTYRGAGATNPIHQVTYFDGLGRPIQKVDNAQSNSGNDIITHIEYDAFGRQVKDYLSYPTSQNTMLYIEGATANTATTQYYQGLFGDANPYSEKQLEASPLDKVLKQAAPGNSWAMNSGHEIKFEYQTNTDSEVKLFKATASWSESKQLFDINIVQNDKYAANELYKTVTKDENWTSGNNNTTVEFKDKEGRVILKRTFNSSSAHDTYYVYDQYGNLTYVLPPLANDSYDQNTLDGLCYQYKYDYRNRLAAKKLPGKQWEYIVYDKQNRPVATGPALSPFGDGSFGVLITVYDAFGRVTETGWKNLTINETNRGSWQTSIDSGSNPFVLATYTDKLSINYYDTYNFPDVSPLPSTVEGQTVATSAKGLPTGMWLRLITTQNTTYGATSTILYDTKHRTIRSHAYNPTGGYTRIDSKLDFVGKVLYTKTFHKRISSDPEIVVLDNFTYNAQDRLTLHTQKINNLPEQLIAKNTYDELGQLISKNVGGDDTSGTLGLQKVDYNYNIRGWLTGINNISNLTEGSNPEDLFAFKIGYNNHTDMSSYDTTPTLLYNGNISETYWKTKNDNILRKYSYEYDNLNRLTQAVYQKPENSTPVTNSYNENIEYDKNGNITYLDRTGQYDDEQYQMEIDKLEYTYHPDNKNQLMKVLDVTNNPNGFKDDSNGLQDFSDDYIYDVNGNMIKDDNKGITEIKYNHLNLPVKITFVNGDRIDYLYNGSGVKLQKNVIKGSTVTTTQYLDGFQYQNNVLQFFPHQEGYVSCTIVNGNNNYNYVFNYTDHLGNTRVSYSKDATGIKILEENNYYPFGLKHSNYNWDMRYYQAVESGEIFIKKTVSSPYKYKLNGKELQDELGLNMYDFGARNYDPAIGRWMNIDPLAENSRRWTPYNYAYNNPLVFVDPDGMQADWFDKKAEKTAQATEKKIDKKIEELNKGNASDKNDRITELNKSKADIADMRNDKNNEYKFDKASNNNNNPETKRTGANEITIYTDDDSKQIHENRHGGQIARGEYDIDSSGNVTKGTFGASKEIDAYKAQYSFEGKIEYIPYIDFNNQTNILNFTLKGANSFKQTISGMGQINNAFLQKLVDNPGINQTPIYPDPATNPTYYQQ